MAKRNDYTLRQSGEQVQADLDKIESLDITDITERVAANTKSIATLNDRSASIEEKVAANTKSIEALNSGKQDKTMVVEVKASGGIDTWTVKEGTYTSVTIPLKTETPFADVEKAVLAKKTVIFRMGFTESDTASVEDTTKEVENGLFRVDFYTNDVEDQTDITTATRSIEAHGSYPFFGGGIPAHLTYRSDKDLAPTISLDNYVVNTEDTPTKDSEKILTSGAVYAAIADAVHFESQGDTEELK